MRYALQRAAVYSLGLLGAVAGEAAQARGFHTSPFCWSEPRIHAESRESMRGIRVERWEGAEALPELLSPNGAYAFSVHRPDASPDEVWSPEIRVFNERPYLLRVVFPDAHAVKDPVWINEQLLFVRVWWGRVAGTDFILDVEREELVHRTPFRYGAIAFQQFKQCGSPEWRDREMCRCLGDEQ